MRRTVAKLALPLFVSLLAPAATADSGDRNLTIAPIYATAALPGVAITGGGLAADGEYGLSDALSARVTASASMQPYPFASHGSFFAGGEAGVTYALDILRVVPFLDAGVVALDSGGRGGEGLALGVELGIGFDDLESRTFSWGIEARYHLLVSGLTTATGLVAIPAYFYLGPRLTWRFPDL